MASSGNTVDVVNKLIFLLAFIISQSYCTTNSFKEMESNSFYRSTNQERVVDLTLSNVSNSTMLQLLFEKGGNANRIETNSENQEDVSKETREDMYKQMKENDEMKIQTIDGNGKGDVGIARHLGSSPTNITSGNEEREGRNADLSKDINYIQTALEVEDDKSSPETALSGFYSDCLLSLSVPCVQRKMLVYIDRLDRVNKYELLGDYLAIVRTSKNSRRPQMTEENLAEARMSTADSIRTMDSLLDYSIKRFFYNHALRVKMPSWFFVDFAGSSEIPSGGRAIKLSLASTRIETARGHGKGAMKMAAHMMKMMMVGKGMMIPVMMGMTKLMGMKGIVMGLMSMVMMKMMLLSKMKANGALNFGCMGGMGGGGGGCGMLSMFGGGGD